MTPEDWQRVKPILDSALQLDCAQRPAFLKQACADPSLRHEIESLIAAHEEAGTGALNSTALLRATPDKGTRLGDFQILSLLGAGGMGEVYRARDLRLDRDVAIKVLPRFVSIDAERLRRFEQEAKAAAALNHPNILAVFQMGSYQDAPYLVSELLKGETLREQVKRGPLPPKKAIDYAVQIAHGLAAAHEKGIVHRDLKPENLFVTRDGRIKILDFGLAKLLHADGETQLTKQTLDTQPGAVMGTVGYMAPEQVRGLAADHRADMFAFGAILYELLTGKRAFHKSTFADTMSAILNEDPPSVSQTTPTVPPALERAVQRCLEKSPEQRFQSASDLAFALELSSDSGGTAAHATASATPRTTWKWIAAAGVALAVVSGTLLAWRGRSSRPLTEKDTIVLADFTNTTEDAVFDDALKQGLAVQLEQSPFLNVLSDQKAQDTLKLMGHSPGDRITVDIARDLCQRVGSKAYLSGAIAGLGSQYVIALNLVNCQTGDSLAREQVTATTKEQVLKSLDEATRELRGKVGESLSSVRKFDVPIEQATTPSLEALKAYSLGMKVRDEKGYFDAIPFFKRAIEHDSDFAAAYASLWSCYANLDEYGLAREYIQKAFELRERASEREKLRISTMYYAQSGEEDKELASTQLWAREYPRDKIAHLDLAISHMKFGQYESSVAESLEALRLDPDYGSAYYHLMSEYVSLMRLNEAKAVYQQALARKLDYPFLHLNRYNVAFLENDSGEMEQRLAWAASKPGVEDSFLFAAACTEEFYGRLTKGRELTRRAIESARRSEKKEVAARYEVSSARTEADYGNPERARSGAATALAEKSSRELQLLAAITLARADDSAHAQAVADDIAKRFPFDTRHLNGYWLPTIQAAIEMNRNNPAQAIEILKATSRLELIPNGELYATYLRAQAYLLQRQGREAATEFQKLLMDRGIVVNFHQGALAHLGLARAYAMQGDAAKAKAAYQNFLGLWKDADPDIPILKEAKAEYAKLR